MQVPTCYPGIVHVRAEQHPAPPKKLADVVLEGVRISDHLARVPSDRRSKKWRDWSSRTLNAYGNSAMRSNDLPLP